MLKFLLIIPALLMIGLFSGCEDTKTPDAAGNMMGKGADAAKKIKELQRDLNAERQKNKDLKQQLEDAQAQKPGPKQPKKPDTQKADDDEQAQGDDQPGVDPGKKVTPPPPEDKIEVAGVEITKFEIPAAKKIDNKAHDDLVAKVKGAVADAANDPTKVGDIKTAVDAIVDVNAIKDDNTPILLALISGDLLTKNAALVKEHVLVPLLSKGANPALKGPGDKTILETDAAKDPAAAKGLVVKTIKYFEPNKSVRDALAQIKNLLAGPKDKLVEQGKTAVADLKNLDPHFTSPATKALAAKVVAEFEGDKLTKPEQVEQRVDALKNFKDFEKINTLSLQDALTLLLDLSN